jgi:polar amino acid transport system substrate-binding protein
VRRPSFLLLVGVAALLGACSSEGSFPDATPEATTTTTAPPAAAAAACTPVANLPDVASIAPDPAQPGGRALDEIRQRGRLIVGVSADTKLFGARNAFTGQLEGFDIDIVREVAAAILGDPSKVEYRVISYAQRLPVIEDGSVDLVAHTMTINCARWERIAFSSEYFHAGQKVLVQADSTATSVADLDGKRICAAEGSTNIDNIAKYPKIKAVGQVDLTDCLVLFQQGSVDGITGDDTVLAGFAAQDPYAKVIGPQFTQEPYGLGMSRKRPELVRFVNTVLQRIRTDGTWQRIYSRWLSALGAPPAPPPAVYGRSL